MTMTNEELAEAVALIFEKDAKRTQGEWKTLGEWAVVGRIETIADLYQTHFDCARLGRVADNAAFIATAPLMAQVIRQIWAEREGQRAVMAQAKEALRVQDADLVWDGNNPKNSTRKNKKLVVKAALAALESVGV